MKESTKKGSKILFFNKKNIRPRSPRNDQPYIYHSPQSHFFCFHPEF